jgi:PKD repeat protein
LLRTYDSDNNGRIDSSELSAAGRDFARGNISQEELNVVDFAFGAGCSFPAEQPESPENNPPNADFLASPQTGTAPFTATFDAIASSDPDGSIQDYSWLFSDRERKSGRRVSKRYTKSDIGTRAARVIVTDDDGAEDSKRKYITVKKPQNEPPEARASYSVQ